MDRNTFNRPLPERREEGFVLVTVIVLLAILTILGTVSIYKTNVQTKVSAGSEASEKAFAAMQAGLSTTFAYWKYDATGRTEMDNLGKFVASGSGTLPTIYVNKYPDLLYDATAGLGGDSAAVDSWVKTTTGVRVYSISDGAVTSIANSNWGSGSADQFAVWATSFQQVSGATYPYLTPRHIASGSACTSCGLVVYSIGRSGGVRRLAREMLAYPNDRITPFGAMVNAPKYANKQSFCDGGSRSTSVTSNGSHVSAGGVTSSHLIDATQAPGSTAIASNNSLQFPSNQIAYSTAGTTEVSGSNTVPYVVYDPGKITSVDYPKIDGADMKALFDSTAARRAVINDSLFLDASKYISYFDNGELLNLNIYREAANRVAGFANETIGGFLVNTGGAALGNAAALRTANAGRGRTGTLQWNEFIGNVQNRIPMYGLVRVMVPAVKASGSGICTGAVKTDPFQVSIPNEANVVINNNQLIGGMIIVYGTLFFDFFEDTGSGSGKSAVPPNYTYDPASERLLTLAEAIDTRLRIDIPVLINPAMAGIAYEAQLVKPREGQAAVAQAEYNEINTYPNGTPWQISTDAIFDGETTPANVDLQMDLIRDVRDLGQAWSTKVHDGKNYIPSSGFSFKAHWMSKWPDANAWLNSPRDQKSDVYHLLDYYVRTTANASKATWSHNTLASIEANHTGFYIDSKSDKTQSSNSAADLYHVFLPNGYVHGWKRAFAMTGLGAASGSGTLWSEATVAAGSPNYSKRTRYFYVTRNSGTGKVYIDSDFADLPAMIYVGGLVSMTNRVNVSGLCYSEGPVEIIQEDNKSWQYFNGMIISGFGGYLKEDKGMTVVVYDDSGIDQMPTLTTNMTAQRKYWQELR